MKSLYLAFAAIAAFSFAPGVYADKGKAKQSSDSILMCTDLTQHGVFSVLSTSIPSEINAAQCRDIHTVEQPDSCSTCVSSLEAQGCRIIDVDAVHVDASPERTYPGHSKVTYLISCSNP